MHIDLTAVFCRLKAIFNHLALLYPQTYVICLSNIDERQLVKNNLKVTDMERVIVIKTSRQRQESSR
jgi:hypothetical protein